MKTIADITLWTGISAEDQALARFETAYQWIEHMLKDEAEAIRLLPLQHSFWAWWERIWEAMDMAFMDSIQVTTSGMITVRPPKSAIIHQVYDEEHIQAIWRDFHHIHYVPANVQIINDAIRKTICIYEKDARRKN